MTILLAGIGILGAVIGLFHLKGRLQNRKLARLAYSGLIMRITVIAVVMIFIGTLLVINKLFT